MVVVIELGAYIHDGVLIIPILRYVFHILVQMSSPQL